MITGLRILRLSFLGILMMTGISPVSASTYIPPLSENVSSDTSWQSNHKQASNIPAPEFVDSGIILPHKYGDHASAWGDYDCDGDLDIVFSYDDDDGHYTRIYRNEGDGIFTEIDVGLIGLDYSYFEWGDYNNDDYLDLLLMGRSDPWNSTYIVKIYRNDGAGGFTDINAGLEGGKWGYGTWGDYDNDGDLDVLLTSENGGTLLYRNDGGDFFTLIDEGFTDVDSSPVAWGDYNQDGFPDVLLTGTYRDFYSFGTEIYQNNGDGTFTDLNVDLIGAVGGSAAWGDYDNDGDLDFLITGCLATYCDTYISIIYRNDGNNTFINIDAGLPGSGYYYGYGSSWGDFDNDGDLDILLSGIIDSLPVTRVYRNDGEDIFTDIEIDFLSKQRGPTAWGDFDDDNDLDLLLSYKIYRNLTNTANTAPTAPTNLSAWGNSNTAYLSWEPSSDDHTSSNTLTYNLRIGTSKGGQDVSSPMADTSTGYRYIPAMGSQYQGTQAIFRWVVPGQVYYWSVQAIDSAFVGSPFATEGIFRLPSPTLQFGNPIYNVYEADGQAAITVTLSESYVMTTTIDYQTGGGTAEPGSDYIPVTGTLSLFPGETAKAFYITILDNDLPEEDETLLISISNPLNAKLGSPSTSELTIQDSDRYDFNDLEITKSVYPPGTLAPWDLFTYTLNFTNNGPDNASSVFITDTLPTLMTDPVVLSSGALITPTLGYTYTWQVENLSPFEGGVITITGILDPGLNSEFVFTNTASIQGYYTDTNPANNSSSVAIKINVPPTADAGGPYTISEGDTVVLDASYSTDPGNDISSYEWDLDNDAVFDDASGISITYICLDDGIYPIGLKVTDEDGATGVDYVDITVSNLPPTLSDLFATSPIEKGTIATLSGDIFDPGIRDAFELSVDWGDGQLDVFNYLAGTTGFIEEHVYLTGGIYTVSLTLGDYDGGTDTAILTIYVNPIYTNDFEAPVGSEWCLDGRSTTPSGRQFLGELGNQTNCLSLTNLPDQSTVTISFDLYIIRSWDGNYSQQASSSYPEELYDPQVSLGPDIWQFQADGQILIFTTFSNWQLPDFRQAYPGSFPNGDYPAQAGAVEISTLQYMYGPHQMDAVYHLSFAFDHSGDMLILYFSATGLQEITDESWGLDNVTVKISTDTGGPYIVFIPMVYRP